MTQTDRFAGETRPMRPPAPRRGIKAMDVLLIAALGFCGTGAALEQQWFVVALAAQATLDLLRRACERVR